MIEKKEKSGIVYKGNTHRLERKMQQAMEGKPLRIGFIGGSITQGSLAGTPQLCYAYLVYEWWKQAFPEADVAYVNAGIGATTSQFAAARVKEDLIAKKPDVVIVEFSVNDESTEKFLETYEGLVRQLLQAENAPAVLLLHNVCYNNGASAELMHRRVGRQYDLTSISVGAAIYPLLLDGSIKNREITPDDLHPNDAGHALVASLVTSYLKEVKEQLQVKLSQNKQLQEEERQEKPLPAPITGNAWEKAARYNNTNAVPLEGRGFVADLRQKDGVTDLFKNGWESEIPGAYIVFEVEGTGVAVQYRRSVAQPAPIAEAFVDADPKTRRILDGNFDETWGDLLALETLAEDLPKGKHLVTVRLLENMNELFATPFYFNAVIRSLKE